MIIEKPWGYEEILATNDLYVMKKIVVREGHRISLQVHRQKRETWYIINGEGAVTLGNTMFAVKPDKVVDIPTGTQHRIYAGKCDIVLIETSTPQLDDIVRIEDDYGRRSIL